MRGDFMGTPPKTPRTMTKVVVAYLDERRAGGYVSDFSALKDSFNLIPQQDPLHEKGTPVDLGSLKAVFFVKEFAGNSAYHEDPFAESPAHGRKIEVTFRDGEKMVGKTEGYNPQKLGFFVIPGDPKSNNERIFVVNRNTQQVKFV
jgi:hypothetical protein